MALAGSLTQLIRLTLEFCAVLPSVNQGTDFYANMLLFHDTAFAVDSSPCIQ